MRCNWKTLNIQTQFSWRGSKQVCFVKARVPRVKPAKAWTDVKDSVRFAPSRFRKHNHHAIRRDGSTN